MKKFLGFIFTAVFIVSLTHASTVFADAEAGKKLFNSKAKKCKTCHKAQGDPNKFKPVGPGLKGIGKMIESNVGNPKEWLKKWLSPKNNELWGNSIGDKAKITGEPADKQLKDIMKRYSAAKKGKKMKKSQMVKNFGPRKNGKPAKIALTDKERDDIIDFLMTL